LNLLKAYADNILTGGWLIKHHDHRRSRRAFWPLPLALAPLAFFWTVLINQLRVEWTVNPQYSYGWFVPVLCLILALAGGSVRRSGGSEPTNGRTVAATHRLLASSLCTLLAHMYTPTRLIQEANPEWRLVSWALALEVIGLTLAFLRLSDRRSDAPPPTFPILYFLTAVPWPTLIEGPVIQALTRFNAAATVACLNWIGTPALQQGNVIEVGTGLVGIEEACSGIRSFQASLMLSLFLGEFYRLTACRRVMLVLAGFSLAIACNLIRTALLVLIGAREGVPAIPKRHDPTGLLILLACFFGLWLLGRRFGASVSQCVGPLVPTDAPIDRLTEKPTHRFTSPPPHRLIIALSIWILISEAGVELWYRAHEWPPTPALTWSPEPPSDNSTVRELPIPEGARRCLRYDEARSAGWTSDGKDWRMIFLRWDPRRTPPHFARSHTPDICLPAHGKRLISASPPKPFQVGPLRLPFRGFELEDHGRRMDVFYCLWEDRRSDQCLASMRFDYGTRLAQVRAGRRNLGQRSLEIAVWGFPDAASAIEAVRRFVGRGVKIEDG
jgi:exosortase